MKNRNSYIAAGFICLVGLILLIVGIVLLAKANRASGAACQTTSRARCDFSEEAVRSGFDKFLQNVHDSYYRVLPFEIVYKSGVKIDEIQRVFRPYDPTPTSIKKVTDTARGLLNEVNNMNINTAKLKPREKKSLYRVKHFLEFNFAIPYDGNYYAGDFLMGPNQFCWQPICQLSSQVRYAIRYWQPREVNDLEKLGNKMAQFKQTFEQYKKNLEYGVKSGMVRSVEECVAGLNAIKRTFFQVALKGPSGIFEEDSVKDILNKTFLYYIVNKTEDVKQWEKTHGKTIQDTVRSYVLEYLGKPIDVLFKYIENDYSKFCVPSTISSGLASLPLSYVYKNGQKTGEKTTKVLPTGEKLDGKEAYKKIMPFFTTNDMTPDDVHELGKTMLNKLYPEVLEIARQVSKENDNDTAKEMFIKRLNESDMFFVDEDIPANESDSNAYNNCTSIEKAKKYCPKRWAAMQRWFDFSNELMSLLDPKTVNMFYFTGYKHTTPNCPVEMRPNFNPSSGAQSYSVSGSSCIRPSYYNIPFFLDRPGPKYEELSVNAHEARPGHHTQVQGLREHFRDTCGGVIRWLDAITYYTAFSEGWGLYAESPLVAKDTDTYNGRPFDKYGMLKMQIWRAIRLIVDTGLHYKGFSRAEALQYFADYAWDETDGAHKEVTRYQSDPGQATAYMIGQLHIMKLRDYAKGKLGAKFDLKDFHFYLLAQGSSPLSFLQESIEQYVECTLDKDKEGCRDVLNPVGNADEQTAARDEEGVSDDIFWSHDKPERPMPDDYI